ncbi:hypothetical protein [Streptomyces bobili]|uniref:Uncharacterized protein n=1 Tax=Streptomyces bobili TaxID=67280 RepID=A0ABZ1QVA2_9ACTN|nr:hypothetical protein [Streptomyces bobili]
MSPAEPARGPNFAAPPPRGLDQTWAGDLAMIRATPLEAARHEFATTATGPSARDPTYHRVGVTGEHGWATTIESLHPGIARRAGGIELGFFRGGIVRRAGDGLLLIPSGFVGARERFRA